MKPEKNVMKHKPTEKPLGKAMGETGKSMFSTKLKQGSLAEFRHMASPLGDNEKERTSEQGNQHDPMASDSGE